jgi:hypothetical protein
MTGPPWANVTPVLSRKLRKLLSLPWVQPCAVPVPLCQQSPNQIAGEICGHLSTYTVVMGECSTFRTLPSNPQYWMTATR